jgi:hypothetical protein
MTPVGAKQNSIASKPIVLTPFSGNGTLGFKDFGPFESEF